MKKKLFSYGIVVVAAIVFFSCNNDVQDPAVTASANDSAAQHRHLDSSEVATEDLVITSRQFKAAGIELGSVKSEGLSETIRATGSLDVPPGYYAEVSTYIGGIIKSINVVEGDRVQKGTIIMTLEHPDFIRLQEEYTSSRSNLDFLEKEYLRQKELFDEKVSSGKVYQEAESKYNTEKGRLSSLEHQLGMLGIPVSDLNKGRIAKNVSLRSPINGVIGQLHGSIGSYAEPNKMLFDVIDNSHIHVHLDVYERDFYKIKNGQRVMVMLPNQENVNVEAKIINIGKSMDPETKSIAVHAEITKNGHQELIPGIFVNAMIYVDGKNVVAVPAEAVIRSGEKQYVFIVNELLCSAPNVKGKDPYTVKDSKGNTIPLAYRIIEVETGVEENGKTQITPVKEIKESDQLVVKGAYYLMSALKSGETVGCCAPAEEETKE